MTEENVQPWIRRLKFGYKAGVTQRGEFADFALAEEMQHKGWWPFSYSILESINDSFFESDEQLLARLYSSIESGKGVYKITERERFENLDTMVEPFILELGPKKKLKIHDFAVSNAITSLDWYRSLSRHLDCEFVASDFFDRLWLVKDGRWSVAFDELGTPIQITCPGFVLPVVRKESLRYFINRITQEYAVKFIIPKSKGLLETHRTTATRGDGNPSVRSVSLYHPFAQQEACENSEFKLIKHDLFCPLASQVDVVRVMNFLTPKHLNSNQISDGFIQLLASVRPGGLLLLGRTQDEADGSLLVSLYKVESSISCVKIWQGDGPWEGEYELSRHKGLEIEDCTK